MKIQKLTVALLTLLIVSFCDIGNVRADSFPPLPEALAAMESDDAVTVREVEVEEWPEDSDFYYAFEPNNVEPTIGFIIYPGALLDPRAYAPAAHAIAAEGYLNVIVKMPNDIAYGNETRANKIISDYSEIEKWIIGGHSLGGVSACAYAKKFTDKVDGVVLWASYPSGVFRIDDKDIKVISIYGTKDGLCTLEEIEISKEHLPPDTQFVPIEGGNHTQFGWYDTSPDPVQPEDNPADITREEQQNQINQATINFLKQFSGGCPVVSLLGEEDPRLDNIRQFRDKVLSKRTTAKKLIGLYYKNGERIIEIFDRNPTIKKSAKMVLESLIPAIEFLVKR
ncbi:MAG: alpha/beta hydrolase [Thermoplasmata archaeon]|nr:MAG: alpha/beta hydrolase [Thermoplasmata archaeon]